MTIVAAINAKNEAAVIARCIRSVAPHVSGVVLCDTGSTDATIEEAVKVCGELGLPMSLHHAPWRSFAANYTELLELARSRADYVWVLDADHVVDATEGFVMPELTGPGYSACRLESGDWENWYPCILRSDAPWRYEGERHAVPRCGGTIAKLRGLDVRHKRDGASVQTSPEGQRARFARDAEHFRSKLTADPNDTRSAYYLAQSLHDAGLFAEARDAHARRASMAGGFAEEAYLSRLYVAQFARLNSYFLFAVESALLSAFTFRPTRAEAPCEMARWYNDMADGGFGGDGGRTRALHFAERAIEAANTDDLFLVRRSDHSWRPHLEAARALDALESAAAAEHWAKAMAFPNIPAPDRHHCERSISAAEQRQPTNKLRT